MQKNILTAIYAELPVNQKCTTSDQSQTLEETKKKTLCGCATSAIQKLAEVIKTKVRITQTLLSSWIYSFKLDNGYEDFFRTLNREKKQPTKQMLDGIRFESCLNNVLDGENIDESHEWYKVIKELANYLDGAQKQVTLFREVQVQGQTFLLHGVLDFLKAGVVYDTKFSKNYRLNKYLSSPQHPLYMALVPEARRFEYLSSDGTYIYKETYPREIVPPIEPTINQFMQYLKWHGLWDMYCEKWRISNG